MNGGNRNIATHNTKCLLCTSILTKPERVRALRENIKPLIATEQERNWLMTVLFGLLREHHGDLFVRQMPTQEEAGLYKIEHRQDEDGTLRIRAVALPARAAGDAEGGAS